MNCPKCDVEMKEGVVRMRGLVLFGMGKYLHFDGESKGESNQVLSKDAKNRALRCPDCSSVLILRRKSSGLEFEDSQF